mgnify:CR=1 FL=1
MNASVIREKDKGKINKITKGYILQVPSSTTGARLQKMLKMCCLP